MSCLSLNKPLRHTKKAFKKSATVFRMKLSKIRRSKALDFLGKIFGKRRGRAPLRHRGRGRSSSRKLLPERRSFDPVYLDELYNQQPPPLNVERVELVPGTEAGKGAEKDAGTADEAASCSDAAAAAATATTVASPASSPYCDRVEEMSEVDLRAEMFIRKFKEEMKRQEMKRRRQRSVRE